MARQKRIIDRKHAQVMLYSPRFDGFEPSDESLNGTYVTDDWGRTWDRRTETKVWIDGVSIANIIKELTEAASNNLEGAHVETIDDYSGSSGEVQVRSWRAATEVEVAEVLRFLEFETQKRREDETRVREHVIAQAKKLGIKPEDLA